MEEKIKVKSRLHATYLCPVCGNNRSALEIMDGSNVRPSIETFIKEIVPDWTTEQNICFECLNRARSKYVEKSLLKENGQLTKAESEVVDAIRSQELITQSVQDHCVSNSIGGKLSDKLAAVGGSWKFIIIFVCILICWITFNSLQALQAPFDPYPYILLNLVLSCIAALQAPIIMMSQNRQESKDRARAEADFKTNLMAELEIRQLHFKLDQLVSHQWHRLLEIQQIQLDMMSDLKKK
ncbi:MAG: DUF1003 domain-containing protein [Bacteriovoracaceae bacterium]|nr:DUF1003 domain-containing protein [Bacteriovoracaceae bacterium]